MKHGEQAVVYQFVYDNDVWNWRATSHQQRDVWVPQNALHHDFILNFCQQFVGNTRVENFLDRNWCPIQCALMDHREATLANLLSDFDIGHRDFAHSCYWGQSS